MPLLLRLLLMLLAGASIVGARLLTRQYLSWQPVPAAAPLVAVGYQQSAPAHWQHAGLFILP